MPILPNPRHEAFAQARARGLSQDDAYAEAGYKPCRQNASRLMTNDDIRLRVEEIQANTAAKAEWSALERLELLQSIALANREKDPRVTVSAISEANKMCGTLAPSKAEVTGKGGAPIQSETTIKIDPEAGAELLKRLVK